jgi:predicted AlkP superfamily phosphohydrolase/phosphomutase
MRETPQVLLIGLDAAEPDLIERWSEDGTLPNLAELFSRGSYGRLAPPDGVLLGPPWPSFYTGKPVSEHGLYEYLVWDPVGMHETRATELCTLEPFWRDFGQTGPRAVVIDVPLVPSPGPIHGVEVTCWATHERLVPFTTWPPTLARDVENTIGRPPMRAEVHHPISYRSLLGERDRLVEATRSVADLAERLLQAEEWDFGLVCFSASHRAGHKLWSETGSNGKGTAAEAAEFSGALRDVYRAIDAAIGRVIALAEPDTHVLVFSLHGMGAKKTRDSLGRLRRATPLRMREWVKRRLPVPLQDRLGTFWRTRGNWPRTRAISLAADLHGFIRINLAGREAQGIVRQQEYDALCDTLSEGLLGFRDADTGAPVVSRVVRRTDLYPEGSRADLLPDLVVVWSDRPAAEHRALVSDRHGHVDWPMPGGNPDGRSGNHRLEGWIAAAGPSIAESAGERGRTILDIAPTTLALLGVDVPHDMGGTPFVQPVRPRRG